MSIAQRFDIGRRGAGSKAQMPDEFLTRSQVIPGTNIWFEYMANWDIKIHANTGVGVTAAGYRFLIAYFELTERPPDLDGQRYNQRIDAEDTTHGSAVDRLYFGSSFYINIRHNWDLNSPHHYIESISSISNPIITAPPEYNDLVPRVIGIDTNTVQVQGTIKPAAYLTRTKWTDNTKTVLLEAADWDPLVVPMPHYSAAATYVLRLLEVPESNLTMTGINSNLLVINATLGV
jgi:hypothetical protein